MTDTTDTTPEVFIRWECQACGACWYNASLMMGNIAAHEDRHHDGAQTVWPVTCPVVTDQPADA